MYYQFAQIVENIRYKKSRKYLIQLQQRNNATFPQLRHVLEEYKTTNKTSTQVAPGENNKSFDYDADRETE